MTPEEAAISVGVMIEGKKDLCPTYRMVADSILNDRKRCEEALNQIRNRGCFSYEGKAKFEEIKTVLLKYHDGLIDNKGELQMITDEVTMKKIDHTKVNVGDIMCFTYFVKVTDIKNNGEYLVVNDLDDNNSELNVQGKELVQKSRSADWFEEEVKETKTKVAELLVHSENHPFTVCFDKTDGEERTLRGRLVKPEPLLGRSMVEDLDVDGEYRLRQVDHRTIKWLIVDGVKHVVK